MTIVIIFVSIVLNIAAIYQMRSEMGLKANLFTRGIESILTNPKFDESDMSLSELLSDISYILKVYNTINKRTFFNLDLSKKTIYFNTQ